MSMTDKFYFLSAFAAIVIGVIGLSLFWSPAYDALTDLGSVSVNKSLNKVTPSATSNWLDWMIVFGYFAFNILICIVLPLTVPYNPIYYIVLFITSFLYTYVVAILANVLEEVIADITTAFTYTSFIVSHLVEFEIMFILIMGIVMFFKSRGDVANPYYN